MCTDTQTHLFVYQEPENIQEDMERHFNNWVVLAKLLVVVKLPADVGCAAYCP